MALDPAAPLLGPGNLPYSTEATTNPDWHFPTKVARPDNVTESPVTADQDVTPENLTLPEPDTGLTVTPPTVADITTEVVDGDGAFDKFMTAGNAQLQSQYEAGRIKGADYAAAYIQMMELMMTQANGFILGRFQAEVQALVAPYNAMSAQYQAAMSGYQAAKTLEDAKLTKTQVKELQANGAQDRTLKRSQVGVQEQQAQLYERQIKGFDDKARNDAMKIAMDAWAVQAVEIDDTGASLIDFLAPAGTPVGSGDIALSIEKILQDSGLVIPKT